MKSSNSIQNNNNLKKKMVERMYHKVLSVVVNECCTIFWRCSLHTRDTKKYTKINITYHKVLSAVVNELLHHFLVMFTLHVRYKKIYKNKYRC